MVRFGVIFGLMISLALPATGAIDKADGEDPLGELEGSKAEKEKDAKELELEREGDALLGSETRLRAPLGRPLAAAQAAETSAERRHHRSYDARGPPA